MKVSIDAAGRVVIPKPLRDQLRLSPTSDLDVKVVEDHLEMSAAFEPATVREGPHGPIVAATGMLLTDDDVRQALESVREHI